MKHVLLICILTLLGSGLVLRPAIAGSPDVLVPQSGVGAKYGSPDPYQCSSNTEPQSGPISADLATQYFICGHDQITHIGDLLIATNAHVQVGAEMSASQKVESYISPDDPAYPIRGSFDEYICSPLSDPASVRGANCTLHHMTNASGLCYRDNFGSWNCIMTDTNAPMIENQPPPPGGNAAQLAPKWTLPQLASALAAANPTPAASGVALRLVAAGQPSQSQIQAGAQLFNQGNYAGAYQAFQTVLQVNPNDPLALLWKGVAQTALGRPFANEIFVMVNNDHTLGGAAMELLALYDWSRGGIDDAKSVLNTCQRYLDPTAAGKCADMMQGVESGASAPDVKDWPNDVGLTAVTNAAATVWKPKS